MQWKQIQRIKNEIQIILFSVQSLFCFFMQCDMPKVCIAASCCCFFTVLNVTFCSEHPHYNWTCVMRQNFTGVRSFIGQVCVSKLSLFVLDLQAPLSLTMSPEAAGSCFSVNKLSLNGCTSTLQLHSIKRQICQLSGELMEHSAAKENTQSKVNIRHWYILSFNVSDSSCRKMLIYTLLNMSNQFIYVL